MITNIRVVGVVWERGYNRPVRGNACSRQHPYLSQRGDAGSGKKKRRLRPTFRQFRARERLFAPGSLPLPPQRMGCAATPG